MASSPRATFSVLAVRSSIFALVIALGSAPRSALATDHFLTIGGGYAPSGNQVSLEKNVLYFRRVLKELHQDQAPHAVLFADGDARGRTLQYIDPARRVPRLNLLLAAILGDTEGLEHQYRPHQLGKLEGGSALPDVDQYFNSLAPKLNPDDRLLLYFTGHGGSANKKDASGQNTVMWLWGRHGFPVSELAKRLDRIKPQTPVTLVMVQCYSGGFANIIFKEGDPAKGLAEHRRAGFCATVHDRVAAGCTPDVEEEEYEEYSSHFWAALAGRTRGGKGLEQPDFDKDGRIGYHEAHAYAIIACDTIDLPVKTSDAFLHHHSVPRPDPKKKRPEDAQLLTPQSPLPALLAHARPEERAVVEALSAALAITGDDRFKAAEALSKKLEDQRNKLGEEMKKHEQRAGEVRKKLAAALLSRWPEMENPWHPKVHEAMEKEGPAVVAFIEGLPRFREFEEKRSKANQAETGMLDLERKWAKCRRLMRAIENLALGANLAKVADAALVTRYAALLELEAASPQAQGGAEAIRTQAR